MRDISPQRRILATAALLIAGLVVLNSVSHGERVLARRPLSEFPALLEEWKGEDWPLEPRIVKAAGVDDYLNRVYTDRSGNRVSLYVGYYSSQRTGDAIHSPKNCLPGGGWDPVKADRLKIQMPTGFSGVVNEYVIENGLERELVLYWYQGRGRVVASEYWNKVCLVVDAVTQRRTDGALIRIVTTTLDGEDKARARAVEFAQTIDSRFGDFIPN